MENLKSCPFCGCKTLTIIPKETYAELLNEYGKATAYIKCEGCGSKMTEHSFKMNDLKYDTIINRLVEKWNSREEKEIDYTLPEWLNIQQICTRFNIGETYCRNTLQRMRESKYYKYGVIDDGTLHRVNATVFQRFLVENGRPPVKKPAAFGKQTNTHRK